MCLPKTPDVPTVPERQIEKLPDSGSGANTGDNRRRRQLAMATVLTQPGIGAPNVTKLGA